MSAPPARGYLGISEVLAELRADFPDISVSKIRFLETEGLITPARSPSGYRRFSAQDIDRLRLVLQAQRDQYLPLKVIRERLDQLDQQQAPAPPARPPARQDRAPNRSGNGNGGRPDGTQAAPDALLSRRELVDAAGLSEALLTELETFGLIRRIGRQYAPEALEVARTA